MENEGWKSSEWLQKGIYFLARGLAESSSEKRGARTKSIEGAETRLFALVGFFPLREAASGWRIRWFAFVLSSPS